ARDGSAIALARRADGVARSGATSLARRVARRARRVRTRAARDVARRRFRARLRERGADPLRRRGRRAREPEQGAQRAAARRDEDAATRPRALMARAAGTIACRCTGHGERTAWSSRGLLATWSAPARGLCFLFAAEPALAFALRDHGLLVTACARQVVDPL